MRAASRVVRTSLACGALTLLSGSSADAIPIIATDVFGGHTYHLLDAATRADSEAEAIALGGHLVTIDDLAENAFVVALGLSGGALQPAALTGAIWIGLSDQASEGTFLWASGAPLGFTHWDAGEPNNLPCDPADAACVGEDFVHIGWWTSQGFWNDVAETPPAVFPTYGVVEVESAVPEPSTLLLLALGMPAVVRRVRRKR
jgi:hypothetical protein